MFKSSVDNVTFVRHENLPKYAMGAPLQRLAIDIMGPLPLAKKKDSYLIVVGTYLTKWIDAI